MASGRLRLQLLDLLLDPQSLSLSRKIAISVSLMRLS
jgi:hypothetical protein